MLKQNSLSSGNFNLYVYCIIHHFKSLPQKVPNKSVYRKGILYYVFKPQHPTNRPHSQSPGSFPAVVLVFVWLDVEGQISYRALCAEKQTSGLEAKY